MNYVIIHCSIAVMLAIVITIQSKKVTGFALAWLIVGILLGMGIHKLVLLNMGVQYTLS